MSPDVLVSVVLGNPEGSIALTELFPKWTNKLPAATAVLAALGAPSLVFIIWYYFSPWNTDVGYQPEQPVPYSHKLHAGLFGMDCRYCHQNVEKGPHATIPPAQTCMNCHSLVKTESPLLEPVRESWKAALLGDDNSPVPWVKVHLLPDYAYFDHSAHVKVSPEAGIGCASCHGRVDQMEIVRQTQPLSMGWCLECHRNPEKHLRPASEVTNMGYQPTESVAKQLMSAAAKAGRPINPPTHCSACHR